MAHQSPHVICSGEVMVELYRCKDHYRQAYAGDTFNTATYLARAGFTVEYLSAIGDDAFSKETRFQKS